MRTSLNVQKIATDAETIAAMASAARSGLRGIADAMTVPEANTVQGMATVLEYGARHMADDINAGLAYGAAVDLDCEADGLARLAGVVRSHVDALAPSGAVRAVSAILALIEQEADALAGELERFAMPEAA